MLFRSVSVMAANNEIGTIQNIKTISKIAHERDVLFHTDAVQAIGNFKIDVQDIEVDAMSISGHKVHAPKGVGALYVKKGVRIDSYIVGGNQERGKRGGTLNVPSIVGFGKALEVTSRDYIINNKRLRFLREFFVTKILTEIPNVKINGHKYQGLPGIVSIAFDNVDSDALSTLLDMSGIAVSTGSACSVGSTSKSHVLRAIGLSGTDAQGTIRFSFGINNTKDQLSFVVDELKKHIEKLRELSPIKNKRK